MIRNLTIIPASVTIPESVAVRTGSSVTAIQIVRRGLLAPRDLWAREARPALKVFPE